MAATLVLGSNTYALIGYTGRPMMGQVDLIRKTRPGVEGQDYIDAGAHGTPSQMTIRMAFTNGATRASYATLLMNDIGGIGTFTEYSGTTWPYQMLVRVPALRTLDAALGGNSYPYILEADIVLEAV